VALLDALLARGVLASGDGATGASSATTWPGARLLGRLDELRWIERRTATRAVIPGRCRVRGIVVYAQLLVSG
jgi:hypothetical protein